MAVPVGSVGSRTIFTQALPLHCDPHPAAPHESSWGTTWPTFSVHGFEPPVPGVIVGAVFGRSGIVSVATPEPRAPSGQSFESWKVLFATDAFTTSTLPFTVHGFPRFGPVSQVPVSQRGQTLSVVVTKTSDLRLTMVSSM